MRNLKLLLIFCLSFPAFSIAQLDFKYDDTAYKTIYAQDLCDFLHANPKTMLVDVRTKEEFLETTTPGNLNIGRLKGAVNIPIDQIEKNPNFFKNNPDSPIIFYCSHSQRSRRVSKLLANKGHKNVINLNGGLTLLTQTADFPCQKEMIVSALPYKNIGADEALRLIANTKGLMILDTRDFLQFEGKDTVQSQNIGRIKDAYSVPASRIQEYAEKLDTKKTYLIYDAYGNESNNAAKYLSSNGYANVYHLLGGLAAIIGKDRETLRTRKQLLTETPAYTILNGYEAINLLLSKKPVFVIDARPAAEFQNKAKEQLQNLGHVKNAVNISRSTLNAQKEELQKHKNETIVVYGSDAASIAAELKKMGFENVNLVFVGLWEIVSATHNIKSLKQAKSILVDHEGLY